MSKIIQNKNLKKRKPAIPKAVLCKHGTKEDFDVGRSLWLYRFVYSTRFSLSVVVLLLLSFSLQSTERVFADSETLIDTNSAVYEEVLDLDIELDEPKLEILGTELEIEDSNLDILEDEILDSNIVSTDSIEVPLETELINLPDDLFNEDLNEVSSTSATDASTLKELKLDPLTDDNILIEEPEEDIVTIDLVDNSTNETIVDPAENEIETNDSGTGDSSDELEISSSSDLLVLDSIENQSPTTSDLLLDELLTEQEASYQTVYVTESDSEFSFSKDECTQLATGSYYCLKPQQNELSDALFSAPDEDGDLEIFLIRDGVQVQITNNLVDDAAPYYDQNSETLVWHRLVDDTYQIISFNPKDQKEIQMTNDTVNNMEPTRQGEYTVWQRWTNDAWNIVLFDGEDERQITKNNSHNVAPYIHGSLVVWNSKNQSGDKTIEMYDIDSDTYVTVDDPDGLSVSNPRMVFVYDSLHPNGDIVTRGYDVMAKKFIDLSTLPRDLPEELPPADSTGETRALIQSKPSIKSEIEESFSTSSPNIIPPVPLDNASNTDAMTLDLSFGSSTDNFDNTETEEESLTPTEFDIVIEPFIVSTTSATESVQE